MLWVMAAGNQRIVCPPVVQRDGFAWWINKLMAGAQYRRRESRRSRMSTGKGREKTQLQGKEFRLQSVRQSRTTTKIKKEKRIGVTEILLKDPAARRFSARAAWHPAAQNRQLLA